MANLWKRFLLVGFLVAFLSSVPVDCDGDDGEFGGFVSSLLAYLERAWAWWSFTIYKSFNYCSNFSKEASLSLSLLPNHVAKHFCLVLSATHFSFFNYTC